MTEERIIRINTVLRELNISLDRACEFLLENNIIIERSPNAKLKKIEYEMLLEYFSQDKSKREASKAQSRLSIDQIKKKIGVELDRIEANERGTRLKKNSYYINNNKLIKLSISSSNIDDISFLKGHISLTYLELEGNFKNISVLRDLNNIEYLSLISSELINIHSLTHLKKLESLIVNCKVKDFSPLLQLKKLENLNLQNNGIKDITILKEIENLKVLNLDNNLIEELLLSKFKNLKVITANNNKIKDISSVNDLSSLMFLSLKENLLEEVNLKNINNLLDINLSNNPLNQVILNNLDNLISLEVNNVKSLNKLSLSNLPKLKNLLLSNCNIRSIKDLKLSSLNLSLLDLCNNLIVSIAGVENQKDLKHLLLNGNRIENISQVSELKKIETLSLVDNQISNLYPLRNLSSLKILSLKGNHIVDIRPLQKLSKLQKLFLQNNYISDIKSLKYLLSNLEEIYINQNPIVTNEDWKLNDNENNLNLIKNYFSSISGNLINYKLPAKVLLLGNHATGKSTLLNYLLNDGKEIIKSECSTHIIQIQKKPTILKDNQLPSAIYFDFGGQDYYHGLYKAFLTNDTLNLLLWNYKSNQNGLREDSNNLFTRDFTNEYWLYQLKHSFDKKRVEGDTEPIILIQTSADLKESSRKAYYDKDEIFSIINEFYISLDIETLKKNRTLKGSLEFLNIQINDEVDKKQKAIQRPAWFGDFLRFILNSTDKNCTSITEIRKEYKRTIEENETESEIIEFLKEDLDQLHKKGIILYYKDELSEVAWLNPMNTVQYIHDNILSQKLLKESNGVVNEKEFNCDKNILNLLMLQKVIFFDKSENNYIIPNFLPLSDSLSNKYDIITFGLNKPQLTLSFEKFLPFGIVNQLIIEFGQNPDIKHFWRDQIIFTLNNEVRILIKLNFSQLKIETYYGFLNNNEKRQNLIKKYIFNCLIAIYWDINIISFDKYLKLNDVISNNHINDLSEDYFLNIKKIKFKNLDSSLEKYRDVKFNFEKENIFLHEETEEVKDMFNGINFIQAINKLPDDLFLSIDNKTFINGGDFIEAVHNELNFIDLFDKSFKKIYKQKSLYDYNIFTNKKVNKVKKIFISYSKQDLSLINELLDHLSTLKRDGLIATWYCTELIAGGEWDRDIQKHFDDSDLIFFMISSNLIRTDYVHKYEISKAFERKKYQSDFKIVPIILDFCSWSTKENNLSIYTALPYTAKPVADFNNRNMAWYIIVECIRVLIQKDEQPEGDEWFYNQKLPIDVRRIYERIVKGLVDNNSL
ncbi:leucine-rich repeat domain-containing protein [Flavobacterium rakeshii]|uniref:leucine-rich repeat domain-containing protein n=1 Tax=Flavobacterium rakeshii TaxID=1038845 RepID=UPI002E7C11BC|nr:leucine-rich repeat domain-containing protein [Flavobacterium rakeshii]MEE1899989.1 leucine-rich repeat domain-containing protein [Flavobacterium rakeshii]